MGALLQLVIGACFGIALHRTGAADFDAMERMFLFEDAHLFALAAMTTLVSAAGLWLLLRTPAASGVRVLSRGVHRGSVAGAVLFGIGWGLSGSCPGTVLAQLGSGQLIAFATLAGVLGGNWLFERYGAKRLGVPVDSCN
jgi:uncharacterized membrane protein YedE/YeeE